jgi:parvulin-like peptidyl-prolyl isomerase
LPTSLRAALEGKAEGELIGPVEADGGFWVFRIEKREAEGTYPELQRDFIAEDRLEAAIAEKRRDVTIKRNLSAADIDWAVANAD